MRAAHILDDVDGDGVEDVLVISLKWRENLPSVAALSGQTGRTLWTLMGVRTTWAETNVRRWHDHDGDGVDDIVLANSPSDRTRNRIELRSGRTGEELDRFEDDHFYRIEAAGDLDGDGLDDFALMEREDTKVSIRFLSLARKRFLDLGIDGRLDWVIPAGDLDGDGGDELVIGRTVEHERRLALVHAIGRETRVEDLGPSTEEGRDWFDTVGCAADLDGNGYWDLVTASLGFYGSTAVRIQRDLGPAHVSARRPPR